MIISASIINRHGKVILSRQFVEIGRLRMEALLSALPQLIPKGQNQMYIETDSIRYIYQHLDRLFLVLITTKNSNLVKDIETLSLYSTLVSKNTENLTEDSISNNVFEILFAFDECISLGYRNSVTVAKLHDITSMFSLEEISHNDMMKRKENEAKQAMRDKVKQFALEKHESSINSKMGKSSMYDYHSEGIGGKGTNVSSNVYSSEYDSFVQTTVKPTYISKNKKIKGMKLSKKSRDIETEFDDQDIGVIENEDEKLVTIVKEVKASTEEKISIVINRDGGVKSFNLQGRLILNFNDMEHCHCKIAVESDSNRYSQIQTHPNIDKNIFKNEAIVGLKQTDKGFPVNQDIPVLRWTFETTSETLIPLFVNCWPTENSNGCEVDIEYELNMKDISLLDVILTIPLPAKSNNIEICNFDGEDCSANKRNNTITWKIGTVDESNLRGNLIFKTDRGASDDFFPLNIDFTSNNSFSNIKVKSIYTSDGEKSIPFNAFHNFYTQKFEIF
ncbi:Coatomer subunit delta [Intoshia linei]|uniref:Coatomer subunit delta n=1 Tax=Intoshia linei TaxID=1819745 RepID=A0A177B6G0_9BILA|nr:Coatomer subunit delta [Intoshia linei]